MKLTNFGYKTKGMDKEDIRSLLRDVRPYFREKLGDMTHKRVSDEWYFHALGFVREELTYVFGFNLGFFVPDGNESYKYAGMSITVRANGMSQDVRAGYVDFFAEHLANWSNRPDERYTSDRGGEGLLLTRYLELGNQSRDEIIAFMKEAIDGIHAIYPKVVENAKLFRYVMCAEMPWDKPFVSLAKSKI